MHIWSDPAERKVGKDARERLQFSLELLDFGVNLRINALERELGSRQAALERFAWEWNRLNEQKLEQWKRSCDSSSGC
jgi:hypothetical protein